MPYNSVCLSSIIILLFHLCLGLPKWSFPQPSPPKPYCISLFDVCYLSSLSHIPIFLDLVTLVVFGVEYKYLKLHSWQFSPAQQQHPIVKHTQSMFLSLCDRRGFMSITKQQAHISLICLFEIMNTC